MSGYCGPIYSGPFSTPVEETPTTTTDKIHIFTSAPLTEETVRRLIAEEIGRLKEKDIQRDISEIKGQLSRIEETLRGIVRSGLGGSCNCKSK